MSERGKQCVPCTPLYRELVERLSGFLFPADRCLYCGSKGPYEMDHFPVPAELGGTEAIRACRHCHNMKDRVSEQTLLDYVLTQTDEGDQTTLSPVESAFAAGLASLLPRAAYYLIDDVRDFPPPVRVLLARRIREQLLSMVFWERA